MDYENEVEFCEYNPISLQYEKELRELAKVVEQPAKNLFERLVEKISLSVAVKA